MAEVMVLHFILLFVAPLWAVGTGLSSEGLRRAQLLSESGLTIIDVRVPSEFAASHIQGAVNLPGGEVGTGSLPKEGRFVVYCPEAACPTAETAAEKLRGLGYSNVAVLEGGLAEWIRRGYPVVTGRGQADSKPKPGRMSAKAAREKIGGPDLVVVDVRPKLEFSAGHLPGARNVPLEELATEHLGLPEGKDVLVYDRKASRSRKAAAALMEKGHRVYLMPGGLAGWVKQKYPLEVK